MPKTSLFVFRRDLRLEDNTALIEALSQSIAGVYPCFIFDPRQCQPHSYRSEPGLRFLLEAIESLAAALRVRGARLNVYEGKAEEVVERLGATLPIDAVYFNEDYTPFGLQRDASIRSACQRAGVACVSLPDALLHAPGQVLKKSGEPYTVFTPFFNAARSLSVARPSSLPGTTRFLVDEASIDGIPEAVTKSCSFCSPERVKGDATSRSEAMAALSGLRNYETERDLPAQRGTSRLSAHLKFGTISPRQAYWAIAQALGKEHPLLRQLYWRDFLTHIAYHFPHVFGHAFKQQYERIGWVNDEGKFEAWKAGRTGFPIVDAGMRELNETGFMHNRVRMITASFLVKDLHIDWRWGERYFAQRLVDYDPCVNNGNWQWAASTGCDAQPYFRIFNPWRQQERFDPDCEYIKRWTPELAAFSPRQIHRWEGELGCSYPAPMVDHSSAANRAKLLFQMGR